VGVLAHDAGEGLYATATPETDADFQTAYRRNRSPVLVAMSRREGPTLVAAVLHLPFLAPASER